MRGGGGWGPEPGRAVRHLFPQGALSHMTQEQYLLHLFPVGAYTVEHLLCRGTEGHTAVDRRGLCPRGSDTPETRLRRLQCQVGIDALKKSQTKERWRETSGWVAAISGHKEELSAKARLTKTPSKWEAQMPERQNIFYLFLF